MTFQYRGEPNINPRKRLQGRLDDKSVTVVVIAREIGVNYDENINNASDEVIKIGIVDADGTISQILIGRLYRSRRQIECVSGIGWDAQEVIALTNAREAAEMAAAAAA